MKCKCPLPKWRFNPLGSGTSRPRFLGKEHRDAKGAQKPNCRAPAAYLYFRGSCHSDILSTCTMLSKPKIDPGPPAIDFQLDEMVQRFLGFLTFVAMLGLLACPSLGSAILVMPPAPPKKPQPEVVEEGDVGYPLKDNRASGLQCRDSPQSKENFFLM